MRLNRRQRPTRCDHPINDYASVLEADSQLVDVREPGEVASGTLPGALNIPLGDLPARVGELDPLRRVVVLCHSGGRSAKAADHLVSAGYGDVVNLAGGILAWRG